MRHITFICYRPNPATHLRIVGNQLQCVAGQQGPLVDMPDGHLSGSQFRVTFGSLTAPCAHFEQAQQRDEPVRLYLLALVLLPLLLLPPRPLSLRARCVRLISISRQPATVAARRPPPIAPVLMPSRLHFKHIIHIRAADNQSGRRYIAYIHNCAIIAIAYCSIDSRAIVIRMAWPVGGVTAAGGGG